MRDYTRKKCNIYEMFYGDRSQKILKISNFFLVFRIYNKSGEFDKNRESRREDNKSGGLESLHASIITSIRHTQPIAICDTESL